MSDDNNAMLVGMCTLWADNPPFQEDTAPGLKLLIERGNPWKTGPEGVAPVDIVFSAILSGADPESWISVMDSCATHRDAPPPQEWAARPTTTSYLWPGSRSQWNPTKISIPWAHALAAQGNAVVLTAYAQWGGRLDALDDRGCSPLAYVGKEDLDIVPPLFSFAQLQRFDMSQGPWMMTWKNKHGLGSGELSAAQKVVQEAQKTYPPAPGVAVPPSPAACWAEVEEIISSLPGPRVCGAAWTRLGLDQLIKTTPEMRGQFADLLTHSLVNNFTQNRWHNRGAAAAWVSTTRWGLTQLRPYTDDPAVAPHILYVYAALSLVASALGKEKGAELAAELKPQLDALSKKDWIAFSKVLASLAPTVRTDHRIKDHLWKEKPTWPMLRELTALQWGVWVGTNADDLHRVVTMVPAEQTRADALAFTAAVVAWASQCASRNPDVVRSLSIINGSSATRDNLSVGIAQAQSVLEVHPPTPNECAPIAQCLNEARTQDGHLPEYLQGLSVQLERWALVSSVGETPSAASARRRM